MENYLHENSQLLIQKNSKLNFQITNDRDQMMMMTDCLFLSCAIHDSKKLWLRLMFQELQVGDHQKQISELNVEIIYI